MPNYKSEVGGDEISGALDSAASQVPRITELMEKLRDRTRDETKEIENFKKVLEQAAESSRKLYGEAAKGMSSFSVAMKAAEDRVKQFQTMEAKVQEQSVKAKENYSKIDQIIGRKMNIEKKAQLQQILGVDEANTQKLRKLAESRSNDLKKEQKFLEANVKTIKTKTVAADEQRKALEKLAPHREKLEHKPAPEPKLEPKLEPKPEPNPNPELKSRKRRGGGIGLMDVISDMRIPGISQAAQVARYARKGADEADGEGGGGLASLLKMGAGGTMGALMGAGAAFGGIAGVQGYKAYNMAPRMGEERRRNLGLLGSGGEMASRDAVMSPDLLGMGFKPGENVQALQGLARNIGGANALQGLGQASKMAVGYGMDRNEIGGQAEGLMMAGGGPGGSSLSQLEKIMSEGVKAGIDRARITQFTSQVIGIQEQLLSATGENSAAAISKTLGDLLRASGKGEAFFKGPEMGALRGFDSAMKNTSRGGGGPGSATLLRAFGFGAGGGGTHTGDEYYGAMKSMEGGLFGKGVGGDATGRARKIIGQYTSESGGNEKVANLRMSRELGVGLNQLEKLRELLAKTTSGGGTKDDKKELDEIMKGMEDPLVKILGVEAKSEASLRSLTDTIAPGILDINKAIAELQRTGNQAIADLAKRLGMTRGGAGTMPTTADGQGVAGSDLGTGATIIAATLAAAVGKVLFSSLSSLFGGGAGGAVAGAAGAAEGGAAGAAGGAAGGILAKLAGGAGGLAMAGGAVVGGAAIGYGVGTGINAIDEHYGDKDQFGRSRTPIEKGGAWVGHKLGLISDDDYAEDYEDKKGRFSAPKRVPKSATPPTGSPADTPSVSATPAGSPTDMRGLTQQQISAIAGLVQALKENTKTLGDQMIRSGRVNGVIR